jgi:probable H4MPT-linked C1 transfer pathway protein
VIILGWDIGGSNTKVCRVEDGRVVTALSRPFEVKDAPDQLPALLQTLAAEVSGNAPIDAHAVTMTAELSRNFSTKREGVAHVLDAVRTAFEPRVPIAVFTVRGEFVSIDAARDDAISVASANWMATARRVAEAFPDALLIDVGSTTTDIIPIEGGKVVNVGCTDPERLASGELVYTGVTRTPVEGLAHEVGIADATYGVAAERFATSGDVYVWLGDVPAEAYQGPTADGRPAARPFAAERLRRALCADRELMDDVAVTAFANALAAAQADRVAGAVRRVASARPGIRRAVVAGTGAFIAARAARTAGLDVVALAEVHGDAGSRCAPAAAVALLLERRMAVRVVVKVGGSLMAHERDLAAVLHGIEGSSNILIVPGGGSFADAVRDLYGRGEVDDDEAHWGAVLAMDRYAEWLAARMSRGRLVRSAAEARQTTMWGQVPVLAPSRWVREADPLPHSWDVTSDSIAAWIAGEVGAPRLVLIKPPHATGRVVDAYFERALPAGIETVIVPAHDESGLETALDTGRLEAARAMTFLRSTAG